MKGRVLLHTTGCNNAACIGVSIYAHKCSIMAPCCLQLHPFCLHYSIIASERGREDFES